jgi:hypothetical protein
MCRLSKDKSKYKKIAGVPILNFDPNAIDSDLDVVNSDMVRSQINAQKSKNTQKPIENQGILKHRDSKQAF